MKGKILFVFVIALLLAIAGAFILFGNFSESARARQIIKETGVEGGLVVHLGFGEGRLTAALHGGESYIVHGLSLDEKNVGEARSHIRKKGLYGKVSVEQWDKEYLPYTDNLVNLIVAESTLDIPEKELLRVLVPEGILYIKKNDRWEKITKSKLVGADEWTHFLHGPDNNAVAQDTLIGPVHHLQWDAPPKWARSHDHLASTSAMVSSGGRIFSIEDNGPIAFEALPAKWEIIARDAYNGIVLWKKDIGPWEHHLRLFRNGPTELPRRMVAIGDVLFVTLGYNKPLTALDAATGKILKTYDGTEGTMDIIYEDSVLYLVTGERKSLETIDDDSSITGPSTPSAQDKKLMAVYAETGHILWDKADASTSEIIPTAICTQDSRLFYENPEEIVCLDVSTGKKIWDVQRFSGYQRPGWSAPTLVIKDGILYSADREVLPNHSDNEPAKDKTQNSEYITKLIAYSARDGEILWEAPCTEGFRSPTDIFLTGDLLWAGDVVSYKDPGIVDGRDPVTGEITRTRPPDGDLFSMSMSHHRCYRNKATSKYLLTGRDGIEFINVKTGEVIPHHWIRGQCQYGIMPCNGMIYTPHHSCACHIRAKLSGVNALKSNLLAIPVNFKNDPRLVRGPAFGKVKPVTVDVSDSWPTYRHDAGRSGSTPGALPDELSVFWQIQLEGKLSSPVVAGNMVYIASVEAYTLYALDRSDGKKLWQFTAGGRIDSPPTYYQGMVFFGSADGRVYCLNAEDGEMVWSFRTADRDHRIVSSGRIESTKRVHGNVLIEDGQVYFAAGISSYLDDGIYLYKLDAVTGEILSMKILDDRDPATGNQPLILPDKQYENIVGKQYLDGALTDIMSSNDQSVFMRHKRFTKDLVEQAQDVPHLYSAAGYLDDSWWHRSYWIFGEMMGDAWGSWWTMGKIVPSGRLLVKDGNTIYGLGRSQYGRHGSHVGLDASGIHGFKPNSWDTSIASPETTYQLFCTTRSGEEEQWSHPWLQRPPLLARTMVKTQNSLCLAGIPYEQEIESWTEALQEKGNGLLCIVSPETGDLKKIYKLASSPVWDGMAVAGGSLYMSLTNGSVICLSGME